MASCINPVIEKLTADIPADPEERTAEQQARWILANVLDWHRREDKAVCAGIVAWREELAPAVDTRVVFKDSGFPDDVAKTNMAAILNQNGISDVRSL